MPHPLRSGGLYRCCGLSVEEQNPKDVEGARLQCKYCRGWMRFDQGAWEWDPEATYLPEPPKDEPPG